VAVCFMPRIRMREGGVRGLKLGSAGTAVGGRALGLLIAFAMSCKAESGKEGRPQVSNEAIYRKVICK
jgi:hypothetical protein